MSDHRRWVLWRDQRLDGEMGPWFAGDSDEDMESYDPMLSDPHAAERVEVVPASELAAAIANKASGWDSYISRRYKELLEELRLVSEQRDMIAASAEKRQREMDAAYDLMVSRWKDDLQFVHDRLRALMATDGVEGTLIEVELKLVLHMVGDPNSVAPGQEDA